MKILPEAVPAIDCMKVASVGRLNSGSGSKCISPKEPSKMKANTIQTVPKSVEEFL